MQLDAEVLFIGGGPTALSVICRCTFENDEFRNKFKVVEPSGLWMAKWRQQFAAQEIQFLRSPVIYHPHRRDEALFEYAESARQKSFEFSDTQLT